MQQSKPSGSVYVPIFRPSASQAWGCSRGLKGGPSPGISASRQSEYAKDRLDTAVEIFVQFAGIYPKHPITPFGEPSIPFCVFLQAVRLEVMLSVHFDNEFAGLDSKISELRTDWRLTPNVQTV